MNDFAPTLPLVDQTPSSFAELAPMLSEYTRSEYVQLEKSTRRSSGASRSLLFTSLMRACLRQPKVPGADLLPPADHPLHQAHQLYGDLACALVRQNLRQRSLDQPPGRHSRESSRTLGVLISPYWQADFSVREIDLHALVHTARAPGNQDTSSANPLAWVLKCELMLQLQLPVIRKKGYRDVHIAFSLSQTSGPQALTVVVSMDELGHSLATVVEGASRQRFQLGSISAAEVAMQCAFLHTMGIPPIVNREIRAQALQALHVQASEGLQCARSELVINEYGAHILQAANTDAQVHAAMARLQDAQMLSFATVLSQERDSVMQPLGDSPMTDVGLRRWVLRQLAQGRSDSPRWAFDRYPGLQLCAAGQGT